MGKLLVLGWERETFIRINSIFCFQYFGLSWPPDSVYG